MSLDRCLFIDSLRLILIDKNNLDKACLFQLKSVIMFKTIYKTITLSLFLGLLNFLIASPVEMVTNGEFEIHGPINPFGYQVSASSVTGWSFTPFGNVEIWPGSAGAPALGTDGLATGDHLELQPLSAVHFTASQTFTLANDASTALFSFDMWPRLATPADGVIYTVQGTSSGIISSGTFALENGTSSWHLYSDTLSVIGGEDITLTFENIGTQAAHIDQVSFLVSSAAVPEPSAYAMLALGLVGLCIYQKKRKK